MIEIAITLLRQLAAVLFCLTVFPASAVVIVGTRIVYPAEVGNKFVQVSNTAEFPNVVQVWLDSGDPDSKPESARAPFIVAPPIFRMEPKMGHLVRIVYDGTPLPQDRESLYYFNVLQIPPKSTAARDKNQLNLLIRHRLKLFYRPAAITQSINRLSDYIRFNLQSMDRNWQISVHNDSGYYVTFSDVELRLADNRVVKLNFDMLAPYSSQSEDLKILMKSDPVKAKVNFSIINDHGASVEDSYKL